MKKTVKRKLLNTEEVLKFHKEGWCGPFDLMSKSKMSIIKKKYFLKLFIQVLLQKPVLLNTYITGI